VSNQNATSSKNVVIRKKAQRERNAPEWMISFFHFQMFFPDQTSMVLGAQYPSKENEKEMKRNTENSYNS